MVLDDDVALRCAEECSRLIGRLSKKQLLQTLKVFAAEGACFEGPTNTTRIRNIILQRLNGTLTYKQLADLSFELTYQFNGRKWDTFELGRPFDNYEMMRPDTLLARSKHEISAFFPHYTSVHERDQSFWIRSHIVVNAAFKDHNRDVFYAIVRPHSPYVLVSLSQRTKHRPYWIQALQSTLNCGELTPVPLSGKDPAALTQMLLNQNASGPWSNLGADVDLNPLAPRPRKRSSLGDDREHDQFGIVSEEASLERQNKRTRKELMGDQELPPLTEVTYKVRVPLALDGELVPMNMRVCFRGPNISEGFKEMADQGLVSTDTLPDYMYNLHAMARSELTIEQ